MKGGLTKHWAALLVLSGGTLATSCGSDKLTLPPMGTAAAAGEGESGANGGETDGPASGGAAGSGIGEGGSSDGPPRVNLGASCETSDDCDSKDLTCVASTEAIGEGERSVAHGVCTRPCQEDTECRDLDPNAFCLAYRGNGDGHCIQGCQLNSPPGDQKCHGRTDVACEALTGSAQENCSNDTECPADELCVEHRCSVVGCRPLCTNDAQCPEGRYCDPAWGLCSPNPSPHPEFGDECSNSVPRENQCGGIGACVTVLADDLGVTSLCTQSCVLGYGCANGRGACVLGDHGFEADVGDRAYCAPACNCNDDCKAPRLACVAAAFDFAPSYRGLCVHPAPGDETLPCSSEAE